MNSPLILATGFSVFPGAPENPTAWAMEELGRSGWQPDRARLVTRTLPVTFDLWDSVVAPLLAELKPDAVVAFGLSAKALGVTLESTARNRVAADRPDFSGAYSILSCVSETGPEIYPTRLPMTDIVRRLHKIEVPFARSDDAGDYVCNLLFYKLMALADAGGPRIAGFVHVPYLDSQVARLAAAGNEVTHTATLAEAQLMTAVKSIVSVCADALAQKV